MNDTISTYESTEATARMPVSVELSLVRVIEIILAGGALLVFSPLIVLLAVWIRLDSSGPVVFRQIRLGYKMRPFVFYKFRTMYADAATRFPELYNYAANMSSDRDFHFKRPRDPRLTRVGEWLRRTGLDELPNLVNVLKGDCAVVGPRPDIPDVLHCYTEAQRVRFEVRQGLTCLAQVNGANHLTFAETADLDAIYATTRSWPLDLKIIVLTVRTIVRGDLH